MRLVFLNANRRWVVLFGDTPTRIGGTLLFERRLDAVDALRARGLVVDRAGVITNAEGK